MTRTILRAGAAQTDITPEPGTHVTGDVARFRPAEAVIDPLYAKALVLEHNGKTLCIVALDITIVNQPYTDQIRQAAGERLGIAPDAVMVHATQTHTAPSLGHFIFDAFEDLPEDQQWIRGDNPAYSAAVVEKAVEAVERAQAALRPARMGVARTVDGRFAFNRRAIRQDGRAMMPWRTWWDAPDRRLVRYLEGPIDPEVGVMGFIGHDDRFVALLLHYTCHPVHVFPEPVISADWPGAWSRQLQQVYGDTCIPIVLNGCCGDVNPWNPWDPEHPSYDPEWMGRGLAETARPLIDALAFSGEAALQSRIRSVALPVRPVEPAALEEARRYIASHPRPVWSDDRRTVAERAWVRAALLVSVDYVYTRNRTLDYEIQAMRIGNTALVGLPGEPFAEGGLRIKTASPAFPTFVAHCTTHYAGYLPTRRAFQHGGHEVDTSSWSKFMPDALDTVVEETLALLSELMPARNIS